MIRFNVFLSMQNILLNNYSAFFLSRLLIKLTVI